MTIPARIEVDITTGEEKTYGNVELTEDQKRASLEFLISILGLDLQKKEGTYDD